MSRSNSQAARVHRSHGRNAVAGRARRRGLSVGRALGVAAALASLPASLRAAEPVTLEPAAVAHWHDGLRVRFGVEGAPDVDYGAADVSWLRATGLVSLAGPVSERWHLGVSLSAELLSPELDGSPESIDLGVAADETLDDLIASTLRVGARVSIRERWALGADGYFTTKLEAGADFGNSLRGGTILTLGYRRSDALDVVAGVKLGSRLDRSGVFAWPVLRVQWQITDRLGFELNNATLQLGYALREGLVLLGFGGARSDRFRLEEQSSAASDPGTLGVRDARVGVGLRWDATARLRVVASVGALVWQELNVDDASADRFDSNTAHGAAPFAALQLRARF